MDLYTLIRELKAYDAGIHDPVFEEAEWIEVCMRLISAIEARDAAIERYAGDHQETIADHLRWSNWGRL